MTDEQQIHEMEKDMARDFDEIVLLKSQLEFARAEYLDWERWAKEVLTDFRIPFDDHKTGMRLGITQWMADKLHQNP